jgi:hypothetical protein
LDWDQSHFCQFHHHHQIYLPQRLYQSNDDFAIDIIEEGVIAFAAFFAFLRNSQPASVSQGMNLL